MIAETMAGIALFKASVEGIKSAIGTANDVSSIAKYIDGMFTAQSQVNKDRYKKSASQSITEQFGVSSVAEEIIDAKLVQEQMREIATMVDMRFGHGTWAGIIAERARRIQEAKELAKAERIEKARRHKENMETLGLVSIVMGIIITRTVVFLIWLSV